MPSVQAAPDTGDPDWHGPISITTDTVLPQSPVLRTKKRPDPVPAALKGVEGAQVVVNTELDWLVDWLKEINERAPKWLDPDVGQSISNGLTLDQLQVILAQAPEWEVERLQKMLHSTERHTLAIGRTLDEEFTRGAVESALKRISEREEGIDRAHNAPEEEPQGEVWQFLLDNWDKQVEAAKKIQAAFRAFRGRHPDRFLRPEAKARYMDDPRLNGGTARTEDSERSQRFPPVQLTALQRRTRAPKAGAERVGFGSGANARRLAGSNQAAANQANADRRKSMGGAGLSSVPTTLTGPLARVRHSDQGQALRAHLPESASFRAAALSKEAPGALAGSSVRAEAPPTASGGVPAAAAADPAPAAAVAPEEQGAAQAAVANDGEYGQLLESLWQEQVQKQRPRYDSVLLERLHGEMRERQYQQPYRRLLQQRYDIQEYLGQQQQEEEEEQRQLGGPGLSNDAQYAALRESLRREPGGGGYDGAVLERLHGVMRHRSYRKSYSRLLRRQHDFEELLEGGGEGEEGEGSAEGNDEQFMMLRESLRQREPALYDDAALERLHGQMRHRRFKQPYYKLLLHRYEIEDYVEEGQEGGEEEEEEAERQRVLLEEQALVERRVLEWRQQQQDAEAERLRQQEAEIEEQGRLLREQQAALEEQHRAEQQRLEEQRVEAERRLAEEQARLAEAQRLLEEEARERERELARQQRALEQARLDEQWRLLEQQRELQEQQAQHEREQELQRQQQQLLREQEEQKQREQELRLQQHQQQQQRRRQQEPSASSGPAPLLPEQAHQQPPAGLHSRPASGTVQSLSPDLPPPYAAMPILTALPPSAAGLLKMTESPIDSGVASPIANTLLSAAQPLCGRQLASSLMELSAGGGPGPGSGGSRGSAGGLAPSRSRLQRVSLPGSGAAAPEPGPGGAEPAEQAQPAVAEAVQPAPCVSPEFAAQGPGSGEGQGRGGSGGSDSSRGSRALGWEGLEGDGAAQAPRALQLPLSASVGAAGASPAWAGAAAGGAHCASAPASQLRPLRTSVSGVAASAVGGPVPGRGPTQQQQQQPAAVAAAGAAQRGGMPDDPLQLVKLHVRSMQADVQAMQRDVRDVQRKVMGRASNPGSASASAGSVTVHRTASGHLVAGSTGALTQKTVGNGAQLHEYLGEISRVYGPRRAAYLASAAGMLPAGAVLPAHASGPAGPATAQAAPKRGGRGAAQHPDAACSATPSPRLFLPSIRASAPALSNPSALLVRKPLAGGFNILEY